MTPTRALSPDRLSRLGRATAALPLVAGLAAATLTLAGVGGSAEAKRFGDQSAASAVAGGIRF